METHNNNVIRYYNKVQRSYDKRWMNEDNLAMHLGFWDETISNLHGALVNQNQYVANELQIQRHDVILDAGCGVGGTALWIAAKFGAKVTGINIVKKQVERALFYAQKKGIDDLVDFEVQDYSSTNFASRSFTKIYAIESICHSSKKNNVLKEAYRLLKPGGRLVIIDAFLTDKEIEERHVKLLRDWYYGWVCYDLSRLDKFRLNLRDAGFEELLCLDVTGKIMPSSKILFAHCSKNYRLKKLLNGLKIISNEDFGNTEASISQHYLYKEGIVCHSLLTLLK